MEDVYDDILVVYEYPAVAGSAFNMIGHYLIVSLEDELNLVCECFDLCCGITAADNEIIRKRCLARYVYCLDVDSLL